MSAQIAHTTYALSIHLLTSLARGLFIVKPPQFFFHANLLLVEAAGTAPASENR